MFTSSLSRRRSAVVGAGIAAIALSLVAGCGSSGGSKAAGSSSASTGGGQSSTAAPTGSPIKIGAIATTTGVQASSCSQGATVAPAWADWVNANGGINGHPVEVIVKDDKGDPATAQTVGKELAGSGIAVLVPTCDNLLPAYKSIFTSANIPVVGGPPSSAAWYDTPGMYVTATTIVSLRKAQVIVAKDYGHAKKFANLFCAELAACAASGSTFKAEADKLGIGYTQLAVSGSAASYTAQCLSLQQQGVDYAALNFSAAPAAKFIADCQAQGYNPIFGTSEQSIGAKLLSVSPKTVMYGPAHAFPSVADAPVVKTFVDAMTKYAKDDNWREGTGSFSWQALVAIQKALANVSPTATVTPADVTKGLNSFKDENLGGLLANKVTYTGQGIGNESQPCFFIVGIKDSKTVAPNGLNPVCPTA